MAFYILLGKEFHFVLNGTGEKSTKINHCVAKPHGSPLPFQASNNTRVAICYISVFYLILIELCSPVSLNIDARGK